MLPEKLRSMLRGPAVPPLPAPAGETIRPAARRETLHKDTVSTRQSRGLDHFFSYIRGQTGLSILDLGGVSQANVEFILNLGHRLSSEDFLRSMREAFGADDLTDQSNPGRIDYFLRQNLDYPEEHFDGVLVWDVLEYMSPALLTATVERLYRIVKPRSYLLAFFHADDKLASVPRYAFRIQDSANLHVTQHGSRVPAQLFNNRSLERLFERFESVKFFLTKEHLREVIIKR